MDRAPRAYELEQRPHLASACGGPGRRPAARVHQTLQSARHEAIVDEEVLVNVEAGVVALEIAGTVAGDAVAQREILGSCWCADRIRLHETQDVQRTLKRGRLEEAASDGGAPDVVESHWRPAVPV